MRVTGEVRPSAISSRSTSIGSQRRVAMVPPHLDGRSWIGGAVLSRRVSAPHPSCQVEGGGRRRPAWEREAGRREYRVTSGHVRLFDVEGPGGRQLPPPAPRSTTPTPARRFGGLVGKCRGYRRPGALARTPGRLGSLALLAPHVPGEAPRLVDVQHEHREQHDRTADRMDESAAQRSEIVTCRSWISRDLRYGADRLRLDQQDDRGDPYAEIGGQAGGCDDPGGSDGLPRRRCLLRHRTKGTPALPPLRREQGERTSGAVRRRADMLRAARGAIHGNDEQVDGRPCLGGDRHTGTGVRVDVARPDGGSSGPRTRYARARGRNASRPPAVRDIPGVERHGRRVV